MGTVGEGIPCLACVTLPEKLAAFCRLSPVPDLFSLGAGIGVFLSGLLSEFGSLSDVESNFSLRLGTGEEASVEVSLCWISGVEFGCSVSVCCSLCWGWFFEACATEPFSSTEPGMLVEGTSISFSAVDEFCASIELVELVVLEVVVLVVGILVVVGLVTFFGAMFGSVIAPGWSLGDIPPGLMVVSVKSGDFSMPRNSDGNPSGLLPEVINSAGEELDGVLFL